MNDTAARTAFWRNRKVLITGHTGFKGAWLSLLLHRLGADVTGYALAPPTEPSLFELSAAGQLITSLTGDVRDRELLQEAVSGIRPEVVIHMAAQPIVLDAYESPVETYEVNVMGTVNLLEAVRRGGGVKAVINVTTDKCYENRKWVWGYRENDPLGGDDPYSSSKSCSELVTKAYRRSFFRHSGKGGALLATARAGNVIGGGDWAHHRLVPDCVRGFLQGEKIRVRNPRAVRPWQHVLEPLDGYLMLAEKLSLDGREYEGEWNFGPDEEDARTVEWVVGELCARLGHAPGYECPGTEQPHEARYLKLDCSKAKTLLGWQPRWSLGETLDLQADFVRAYREGKDLRALCLQQIETYYSRNTEGPGETGT